METGLTAREYLSRDPVLHIDMLENLRRGAQRLLYEGNDGVLLHDTESDCYILSAPSPEAGRRLLALAGSVIGILLGPAIVATLDGAPAWLLPAIMMVSVLLALVAAYVAFRVANRR